MEIINVDEKKPTTSSSGKQSDFSIEHILNKAGVDRNGVVYHHHQRLRAKDFSELDKSASGMDRRNGGNVDEYVPMLNWLNYTRYRPPRLPSKYIQYIKDQHFSGDNYF